MLFRAEIQFFIQVYVYKNKNIPSYFGLKLKREGVPRGAICQDEKNDS